jgi:hypothetical protein
MMRILPRKKEDSGNEYTGVHESDGPDEVSCWPGLGGGGPETGLKRHHHRPRVQPDASPTAASVNLDFDTDSTDTAVHSHNAIESDTATEDLDIGILSKRTAICFQIFWGNFWHFYPKRNELWGRNLHQNILWTMAYKPFNYIKGIGSIAFMLALQISKQKILK